jgi:hypothetical protein
MVAKECVAHARGFTARNQLEVGGAVWRVGCCVALTQSSLQAAADFRLYKAATDGGLARVDARGADEGPRCPFATGRPSKKLGIGQTPGKGRLFT